MRGVMNNFIFVQIRKSLILPLLLLSISQNIFAADENSNGLIFLGDNPDDSKSTIEVPKIDPVTGARIIIIEVVRDAPSNINKPDEEACLAIKPKNKSKHRIVEPGVEATTEKTIYPDCTEFIGTDTKTYVATESAHRFALDPFDLGTNFKGASIAYVIEKFGTPYKIDVRNEVALQFSKYVPFDYLYEGLKVSFGFESDWIHPSGDSKPTYEPFEIRDTVQGFSITSPKLKLRDGISVGIKWDDVVEKLGKPYYDYTYESNVFNYDVITFRFEVDNNNIVTKIIWPEILGH